VFSPISPEFLQGDADNEKDDGDPGDPGENDSNNISPSEDCNQKGD